MLYSSKFIYKNVSWDVNIAKGIVKVNIMTKDGINYLQKLLPGFKINDNNNDINGLIEASKELDMLIKLYQENCMKN